MMVKLLLEHGADVEIKDADGNTPLDVLPSSHLREAIKSKSLPLLVVVGDVPLSLCSFLVCLFQV